MQHSYLTIDKVVLAVYGCEDYFRCCHNENRLDELVIRGMLEEFGYKNTWYDKFKKVIFFGDSYVKFSFNLDHYSLSLFFNVTRKIVDSLSSERQYKIRRGYKGKNFIDYSKIDKTILPGIKCRAINVFTDAVNKGIVAVETLMRIFDVKCLKRGQIPNNIKVQINVLEVACDFHSGDARCETKKMHPAFKSNYGESVKYHLSDTNGITALNDNNKKIAILYAKSPSMIRFEKKYRNGTLPSFNLYRTNVETIANYLNPLFELTKKTIEIILSDAKEIPCLDTFELPFFIMGEILRAFGFKGADEIKVLSETGVIIPKNIGTYRINQLKQLNLIKECASELGRKRNRRYKLNYKLINEIRMGKNPDRGGI